MAAEEEETLEEGVEEEDEDEVTDLQIAARNPYSGEPTKADFAALLQRRGLSQADYEKQRDREKNFCVLLGMDLSGFSLSNLNCLCGGACKAQVGAQTASFHPRQAVCCRDVFANGVNTKYSKALQAKIGLNQCLTQAPFFASRCLDPEVLQIHLNQEEELKKKPVTANPSPEQLRYAAYRHYTYWAFGRLSTGERVEVPACVLFAVRSAFPDPNGIYKGFEPALNLALDHPKDSA